MSFLDYNVWQEREVGSARILFMWEVVEVADDDDATERQLSAGIADSLDEAMAKIREHVPRAKAPVGRPKALAEHN